MADDEPARRPPVYGSAGMAAAGMLPSVRGKDEEDREEKPAPASDEPVAEESDADSTNEAAANSGEEPPFAEARPHIGGDDSSAEESAPSPEAGEQPPVTEDESPAAGPDPALAEEPSSDEKEPPPPTATPPSPQHEATAPIPPVEVDGQRAAMIGHTGAGDFGWGLERALRALEGVHLEAVADAQPDALDESRENTGARLAYADYRELLERESPSLVVVAPRWTDRRHEMVRASLESEAHVLCEAPLSQTLREADELVNLAEKKGKKLAVVHPLRCDPNLAAFHGESRELIGDLVEMRVSGDMAARAGGADLLVDGAPLFDIVRWFGGDANFCTASITVAGTPALAEDAEESGDERLGPVLGDEVRAAFALESGVHAAFVSDPRLRGTMGPAGIEFVGTRGRARLFALRPPVLSLLAESEPAKPTHRDEWVRWPAVSGEYHDPVDRLTGPEAAVRRVVRDWLAAIEEDREPICSGRRALRALEMVHGVWQAGVTMRRAYFPLVNRLHPLSEDSR